MSVKFWMYGFGGVVVACSTGDQEVRGSIPAQCIAR